jgi:hypothetical protein
VGRREEALATQPEVAQQHSGAPEPECKDGKQAGQQEHNDKHIRTEAASPQHQPDPLTEASAKRLTALLPEQYQALQQLLVFYDGDAQSTVCLVFSILIYLITLLSTTKMDSWSDVSFSGIQFSAIRARVLHSINGVR